MPQYEGFYIVTEKIQLLANSDQETRRKCVDYIRLLDNELDPRELLDADFSNIVQEGPEFSWIFTLYCKLQGTVQYQKFLRDQHLSRLRVHERFSRNFTICCTLTDLSFAEDSFYLV